jgi:Bacterial regulatory proteins, luxR family
VKTHVTNIMGKLGVESRTQAALNAGRLGLIALHEINLDGYRCCLSGELSLARPS